MVKLDKPLTDIQQQKINTLMEQAKKAQRDISKARQEAALDLSMDYDKNHRVRMRLKQLEDNYKDICKRIETVMNARPYYDELLAEINKKLEMAENIKQMYGF